MIDEYLSQYLPTLVQTYYVGGVWSSAQDPQVSQRNFYCDSQDNFAKF